MPGNLPTAKTWLRRARGNLTRARLFGGLEGTFYEDSCFDAQQAVEKAMKAVRINAHREYPRTHAIADLITNVEEAGIEVPNDVREAARLTVYAVSARYPGVSEEVAEAEYRTAIQLAERAIEWAESLVYPVDPADDTSDPE